MKRSILIAFHVFLGISASLPAVSQNAPGLKDAYKNQFYIGTALNRGQYMGASSVSDQVTRQHFNSIVAENCMKSEKLQPNEGKFFFADADQFIEYGRKNNMHIVGHTLIWHSQAPAWFFVDDKGNEVSKEVLIDRMRNHIHTVVGRYKGKVHGWDVVNEAILDNGDWRKSKFYTIIGEEFVELAFRFAREADPGAELYYNDYNMAMPGKRRGVVAMIKKLQSRGVQVDGIGMQGHLDMESPSVAEFEASILAYSALKANVMITELDLSVLPTPWNNHGANIADVVEYQEKMNPYKNGLPDDKYLEWEKRFIEFFRLFEKHSDKIGRVTLWGISDAQSWKNGFPIRGRTDYALLFDRNYNPKPIVGRLMNRN
ncbi:MAG: endo-1,4-beta-xylanase [Bacteroidales bacterium]|nr:endo-1,4-beta-xylanase [Bacteroidales bacterium]